MNVNKAVAVLSGLCLGLFVVVGVLATKLDTALRNSTADAETNRQAVLEATNRLIAASPGLHDSHIDPDVGRVMQAGVEGKLVAGEMVRTNALGMREVDFAAGDPGDTLRIVLLGDSFVFGRGAREDERLGHALQTLLAQAGLPDVEVLHIAVVSWNIRAETAFLRRSLDLIAPDLVVHVVVPNDLDDCAGVRGMGAAARFTPQHRDRTNAFTAGVSSRSDWLFDKATRNHLLDGLDWESIHRYEQAGQDIARLQASLKNAGAQYLLVAQWEIGPGVFGERVAKTVGEDDVVLVPASFARDKDHWVSPVDNHWNASGHLFMARLVLGALVERGHLDLPHALADEDIARIARNSESYTAWVATSAPRRIEGRTPVASYLRFDEPTLDLASHVYTGVDRSGGAAPYVAMIIKRAGPSLEIRAQGLSRPALPTVTVQVAVDRQTIGQLRIGGEEEAVATFTLPPEVEGEYLTVYLEASDYVYTRDHFERCVAYRLVSIQSK